MIRNNCRSCRVNRKSKWDSKMSRYLEIYCHGVSIADQARNKFCSEQMNVKVRQSILASNRP